MSTTTFDLLIKPRKGFQPIDLHEIWMYRELLGFLAWRDIKLRYKQTALGGLWAILQPLIGMMVFGVLFTRVANIQVDGPPYMLFVYTGLVPWTFFANAISLASNSMVGSEQMVRKIYFPRVLVPIAAIMALGLDMIVSFVFMGILLVVYQWPLTIALLTLPLFMFGTLFAAVGLGLFLAALNVQYRDVKYIVPFFTQMAMFVTPVIYPITRVSGNLHTLLMLNPMSGMVEGFRHALLGMPLSWPLVAASFCSCLLIFVGGILFFHRMQRSFADVI